MASDKAATSGSDAKVLSERELVTFRATDYVVDCVVFAIATVLVLVIVAWEAYDVWRGTGAEEYTGQELDGCGGMVLRRSYGAEARGHDHSERSTHDWHATCAVQPTLPPRFITLTDREDDMSDPKDTENQQRQEEKPPPDPNAPHEFRGQSGDYCRSCGQTHDSAIHHGGEKPSVAEGAGAAQGKAT